MLRPASPLVVVARRNGYAGPSRRIVAEFRGLNADHALAVRARFGINSSTRAPRHSNWPLDFRPSPYLSFRVQSAYIRSPKFLGVRERLPLAFIHPGSAVRCLGMVEVMSNRALNLREPATLVSVETPAMTRGCADVTSCCLRSARQERIIKPGILSWTGRSVRLRGCRARHNDAE